MVNEFYIDRIPDQTSVELDLSQIIGIGGESIVLRSCQKIDDPDISSDTKLAVKASPFEAEIEGNVGFIDTKMSKERQQLPELIPTSFGHKHIIKYYRNLFQKTEKLFHLSGKLEVIL